MGDISKWVKGTAIGAVTVAMALLASAPAEAGIAKTGSVYPVSYLALPSGAVAGSSSGISGPGIIESPVSGDGRFVLFTSLSDNLAPDTAKDQSNLFRKDTVTGDVVMVNREAGKNGAAAGGYLYSPEISANGKRAIFIGSGQVTPDDADDQLDLYLRDIPAGTTTLLTPGTTQGIQSADLSSDGLYATFSTSESLLPGDANTTADVYRLKVDDGTLDLVSRIPASPTAGNDDSTQPAISADGRWVSFASDATDLVTGFVDNNGGFSSDVFIRDMNAGGATTLVSSRFNSATQGGNDTSEEPDLAGNAGSLAAERIAYTSYATDLADNGVTDASHDASVYYKSMGGMVSELISRATGPGGVNANSRAHTPSLSADGKRVIFSSDATNLGAPPKYYGVYMRDRSTSSTSLVSARTEYAVAGAISGDGKLGSWVENGATTDSDPDLTSVFSRPLPGGKISLVSRPKGTARVLAPGFPAYFDDVKRVLSANGRYMAFTTGSSRLAGGSYQASQVYRRDLKTGQIDLVSRASGANGMVSEFADIASISDDGNRIAFNAWGKLNPADTNTEDDAYVRDMTTLQTTLASRADGPAGAVASDGGEQPAISGDGQSVAFVSDSSNLGAPGGTNRVYVRNLASNQTVVASRATGIAGAVANASSGEPMLSNDGKLVIFVSNGSNLDPADAASAQSLFVRDLGANTTALLSRAPGPAGVSLPNFVSDPVISGDGSRVAFVARDDSAVPDTAPWPAGPGQVVVRNLADGTNQLASRTPGGQAGTETSDAPSLSGDGSLIAFETDSTDIRPEIDYADRSTVVVRDLNTGTVSGPPSFGVASSLARGSEDPFVSGDGNCVVFAAMGHNEVSGDLGDMPSAYVYARGGDCLNPLAIAPKLSAVTLKPAKFRVAKKATAKVSRKAPKGTKIRFKLNTGATVTFTFERRKKVRKKVKFVKTGKLVRRNLAAGSNLVRFSGRIGRRALKPGRYRVKLRATNETGASKTVAKAFRVVKR